MFTCVFCRRRSVPRGDPEKKWRRSPDISHDDSSRSIREAKAAQRRWSRAASRWRDNIRSAARRRRTNQALAVSYTTLSREETHEAIIEPERSSHPPSPTLTQRTSPYNHPDVPTSSAASIHSSTLQTQISQVSTPQGNPTDCLPTSPVTPSQPPAYYTRPSSLSPPDSSPEYTSLGRNSSSSSKAPLALHTPHQPHSDDDSCLNSRSGHVATDDKAILSHRAALASAPPGGNSHPPQLASVPSLEDLDTFEFTSGSPPNFGAHDAEAQPPYIPPTSMLPPPPSKGRQKYDYPCHDIDVNFDIAMVEPDLGPSAPPFEEDGAVPTAPPFVPDVPVPSAPPMPLEDFSDAVGGPEGTHRMDTSALPMISRPVSQLAANEDGHLVGGVTPAPDMARSLSPPPPPLPPV
jgi:hypothetical protein